MNPITLTGNLGERHKLLNCTVTGACKKKKSFDDFASFHPQTDADGLIKVDIASHFRNVDYLFEIFKSEDSLLKSRALRCTWFFEGQLEPEVSCVDYLDKNLFPHIAHRTMHRIVDAMSKRLKNETLAEEYFTHFYDSESFPLAAKFLPLCSVAFIRRVFNEKQITLTETHLMKITEKDSDLGYEYFKTKDNRRRLKIDYEKVSRLMVANDACRFLKFYDDFLYPECSKVTLGVGTSVKIMKVEKSKIIGNIKKYIDLLNREAIVKALNPEELKMVLKELLPKDEAAVWSQSELFFSYTKKLKQDKQFKLFKDLYETLYNRPLSIDVSFERGSWKKLLNKEEVQKWALSNVKDKVPWNHDEKCIFMWYRYVDFTLAFPRLRELVKAEPKAHERMNILVTMIDSYCVNRRDSDLLQLLQYFFKFHVNEQMKSDFLVKLLDCTVIYRYNEESWNVINEIFHSQDVYEFEISSFPKVKCWIEIIRRHILKGTEVPEKCLNAYVDSRTGYDIHEKDIVDIQFEERVFNTILDVYVRKFDAIEDQPGTSKKHIKSNAFYSILSFITTWNTKHPTHKKSLFDYTTLITFINNQTQLSAYYFGPYLKTDPDTLRKIIDVLIINNCSEDMIAYCLKHKPEIFNNPRKEILDLITNSSLNYMKFYSKLRIYFPDDLGKFWKSHYLENLTNPEYKLSKLNNCMFALSILLDNDTYLAAMQPYIPTDAKIQWSDIDKDILERSKLVAKYSCNVRPLLSPETVLSFTKGDYLQFVLGSLLSLCNQYPVAKAKDIVMGLIDSPVSVQKHGIRLLLTLFEGPDATEMITNIWAKSKNASIRFVILQNLVSFYTKVSRSETRKRYWPSLEAIIGQLTGESDDKLFEYLVSNASAFHIDFLSKYCECCWVSLVKFDNKTYINNFFTVMLRKQTSLNAQFCTGVILNFIQTQISTELIFKELNSKNQKFYNEMREFIVKFLLCVSDETVQNERIVQIYEALVKELKLVWNAKRDTTNIADKARKYYSDFLKELLLESFNYYSEFINSKKLLTHILADMSTFLPVSEGFDNILMTKLVYLHHDVFEPIRLVEIEFNADLTLAFLDSFSECCITFGKKCADMLRELIETYFPHISILFQKTFDMFLTSYMGLSCRSKYITESLIKLNIAKGLISKGDLDSIVAALQMMPYSAGDDLSRKLLMEIIAGLKCSDRVEVVFFLNSYMES